MDEIFSDRQQAGQALARVLARREDLEHPVVLALPRGGVPVAYEIARVLKAPLDVMVVRKLGLPRQPELAMGAVASGGILVLNPEVIRDAGVADGLIERVAQKELREVRRREEAYRGDRPPVELGGRDVVLVDDGIATGATVEAAIQAAHARHAGRVFVAAPVAPPEVLEKLSMEVEEVVCLSTPEPFGAISLWYRSFPQIGDEAVRALLSGELAAPGEER